MIDAKPGEEFICLLTEHVSPWSSPAALLPTLRAALGRLCSRKAVISVSRKSPGWVLHHLLPAS